MSSIISEYKKKYTLEQRKSDREKIIKKSPNKIAIILENKIDKNNPNYEKLLCSSSISICDLLFVVRKRFKLEETAAVFFQCNNTLLVPTQNLSQVYNNHKDEEDGLLYISLFKENVFG